MVAAPVSFNSPKLPVVILGKHISKGDEASVRKIFSRHFLFNRKAERRCLIEERRTPVLFYPCHQNLHASREVQISFANYEPGAHMLRFHTSNLAHILFPENFPKPVAVRFELDGKPMSQHGTASLFFEFIPDACGMVGYIESQRAEFRKNIAPYQSNPVLLKELREQQEKEMVSRAERACNFGSRVFAVREAGIGIIAPEWNFHVRNNEPVFFEVESMDFGVVAEHISSLPNGTQKKAAQRSFAMCIAIALRGNAERHQSNDSQFLLAIPFPDLCRKMVKFAQDGCNGKTLFSELSGLGNFLDSFVKYSREFRSLLESD
ncbi:MAG: hypothetical protein WCT52_00340 [Candidatus Micrarchaeia archaeon]